MKAANVKKDEKKYEIDSQPSTRNITWHESEYGRDEA